jgi:lipopolysaccharide/colanic/teichoic acid biosynthesis glycosyltransferase
MLMSPLAAVVQDNRTWWHSFSLQAIICLTFGTLLPPVLYFFGNLGELAKNAPAMNSIAASLVAASGGLFLSRKVNGYPGVKQLGSAVPGFVLSYGIASLMILATRVNYSFTILFVNFISSLLVYISFMVFAARSTPNIFYAVPGGRIGRLSEFGIGAIPLVEPVLPAHRGAIVVADLHYDMPAVWERMLAQAALEGIPVFHYKQVYEAATGKVQVEHLSENSLGSLLPNMSYVRAKRALDTLLALLLLPILIVPFALVALAIKLDSPGPALFRQERLGYRGKTFHVMKFRTMRCDNEARDEEDQRIRAMTNENDPRITNVGAFLRRTRIDELPQLFNIISGDMSWIGPRPEAIPLSKWYEQEIPFYSYRHIIRPGLTGWAQVNQGHVTTLRDIHDKLQLDFYYIKNFSYWLDILIVFRTTRVILSGHGAK